MASKTEHRRDKRPRTKETPEERTRNRPSDFTREHFFADLSKVSQRLTQDIEADPAQAASLDRARKEAREGKVRSEQELDDELESDE